MPLLTGVMICRPPCFDLHTNFRYLCNRYSITFNYQI